MKATLNNALSPFTPLRGWGITDSFLPFWHVLTVTQITLALLASTST